MAPRLAIIGCLIIALGTAVCYGAFTLWPTDAWLSLGGVLRMTGAVLAAIIGILNVVAGAAILRIR